jgi:hypothetical protein
VAHHIFSITPHGVGVESSFSLELEDIGWRQSKTTGDTFRKKVIGRQFAGAKNGVLAGDNPEWDTTNTLNNWEIKKEAEKWKFHTMAKVHDFWRCGRAA